MINNDGTTHGIVHAGFGGFRRFVARKKSWCNWIGNCLVIPHDTIPSAVVRHAQKPNCIMKALILIDIQNGLTKKKTLYNESIFFDTINTLIKSYRDSDFKIVFVQHNNNQLKDGSSDWEIDNRIDKQENDCVIQKKHENAFQDTDLKETLTNFGICSITVCGLVSHGCVKATCFGGLSEGFEVSLLKNGHTNWNKDAEIKISETENELVRAGVILNKLKLQL